MATVLSTRDRTVLDTLFDQEQLRPGSLSTPCDAPSSPYFSEHVFSALRHREDAILRPLVHNGSEENLATTAGVIQGLSKLIDEYPLCASAYVNRAQASRLLLTAGDLFSQHHASESVQILNDLDRGIKLATPSPTHDAASLPSAHQSKVLATAHTHRGFLLLKLAELAKGGEALYHLEILKSTNASELEEMANESFARGGRHGNSLGKEMAVKTNPYAKMCGAIVKEALQKEITSAKSQLTMYNID